MPRDEMPAVWGATGFELRALAVSARASLARLREFIDFEQNDLEAFERVDWLLGSTIADPVFGDGNDR